MGGSRPTGNPAGRQRDDEIIEYRLSVWKRLATQGVLVAEIATELHMTRAGLDQMVCRERKRGHPKAVYHANANLPGQGLSHIVNTVTRARRVRREREARNNGT